MDKVSVVRCERYDDKSVFLGIRKSLESIGFGDVKGRTVLLKVSCLMAAPPEKHITTHPAVVSALCRHFLESGARKVQVGDSSGGIRGKQHTANALNECGMADVAREWGAELVDFDRCKIITFEKPYMKIGIAEPVLKADLLVSVPKLKTHIFTKYTGAVKNMFGCLPGASKANVHRIAGGEPRFSEMLVDIYSIVKPQLAVMDAIWGMEGNGPSNGHPKKIGAILASGNPVALDFVASGMIGFKPEEINTNRLALERGMVSKPIDLIGDKTHKVQNFKKPITARPSIMNAVQNLLYDFIRLQPASNKNCIGCATCARSCPVGAIEMVANRPKFDRNRCIYCYCCHELCPHSAIVLKRAPKLPFLR